MCVAFTRVPLISHTLLMKKLACASETAAPPTWKPLNPRESMSCPAVGYWPCCVAEGLRNTHPADMSCKGCVAFRLEVVFGAKELQDKR